MAQYKRRIFLINPKFQFKYVLLTCLFVIVATLIYPWTILDIFESLKQYVQNDINVDQQRNNLMTLLFSIEALILVVLALVMVFFTHKVAGPMYKLQMTFKAIKDEGSLRRVYFRKGDNFQEIAHGFNEVVEVLQAQKDNTTRELVEILENLNKVKSEVPQIKEAIIKLDLLVCEQVDKEE